MSLNNREKRVHFVLIALLIISQAYLWSVASVAAGDAEHSYIIFQDDFGDEVKVVGMFDASTETVVAETLEKVTSPTEVPYTFLIFKDDFEDGDLSDWRVSIDPEIEGSAWKVEKENGNHVLSGEGHGCSSTGDPEWTDYTFEFRIKLIKGWVQINFRVTQKGESQDRYILRLHPPYIKLAKSGIDVKQMGIDLNLDAWYHLKIICLENNIKVYLNDNLKLEYTDEDNPHLSGYISFEPVAFEPTGTEKEPSHILFDDVKVSKIATTSDINDLITYAQSEIDKAKEINADVTAAELKLEQAKQALDQEDYQMVQYFVDEAVWLAKRSSVGQTSITNLRAMATKCSGHVVIITGTIKNLKARYGAGYDFTLDDGTDTVSVTYQGALIDIGNDYKVTVTGIFDAPTERVTASKIEKITGAPTSPPSGISLNLEVVTVFVSVCGAAAGAGAWIVRTRGIRKRRKILFKKMMDEVDEVYSRFKMNAIRCEAELYKLRDQLLDEFKHGVIDEEKYEILNKRIDNYLKEVEEKIARERASKV